MIQIDDYAPARKYLAPFASSLWRWDSEGEVIEWIDGPTIVFRAELEQILARLAPHGLPSLNAVVLLLAACRDGWQGELNRLGAMAGFLATIERREFPDWLGKVFTQLDAVHALPAELRNTPSAKADLVEMVFEDCRTRTSPNEASCILRAFSGYLDADFFAPQTGMSEGFDDVVRELRSLHDGLEKIDAETLRLRQRTGLDRLIRPAEVDLPPAEQAKRLISRLQDDDELSGIARIARHLMAAVHLPRSLVDHEDLPVGGVSDISNRGPLDRLLLSELAHDDLTLAVRVALGEALYLRRESPPKNPPKHRAVLIDAGIRLWGIPRVFATAVALSLTAVAERNIRIDTFRACGQSVEPVNLTQREGIIAHLEALEPDAHPGEALQAFVAAVAKLEDVLDIVIVTGEDVAADRDFQQAVAASAATPLLLATVSRTGRFRLISRGARGGKILREAVLDLEKLLATKERPSPALADPALASLPAIFSQKPFPLFITHPNVDYRRAWTVPGKGVLAISPSRSLALWQIPRRGARLLHDHAPPGVVHWVENSADGSKSLAVVGHEFGPLWLLSIDLETSEVRSFPLETSDERPWGVGGHGGMVFVFYPGFVEVFEPVGGRHVERFALPRHLHWRQGRFLCGPDGWFALSHDGLNTRLDPLLPLEQNEKFAFMTVVDCPSRDGPIAITPEGNLFNFANKQWTRNSHGLPGVPRIVAISHGGERIIIGQHPGYPMKMAMIDVSLGTSRQIFGPHRMHVEPEIGRIICSRNVSHRFRGVCLDEDRSLTLVRYKGNCASIRMDQHRRHVLLRSRIFSESWQPSFIAFQAMSSPTEAGYVLKQAVWRDGSLAVLDSRGMLHLKSSDPTIPEITLVLCDGSMAGWCADGRWFGPSYFIGDHLSTTGAVIYREVLQPFMERLR